MVRYLGTYLPVMEHTAQSWLVQLPLHHRVLSRYLPDSIRWSSFGEGQLISAKPVPDIGDSSRPVEGRAKTHVRQANERPRSLAHSLTRNNK